MYACPHNFATATAWFAPLPPPVIKKELPKIVSPGAGMCAVRTTISVLTLPTMMILLIQTSLRVLNVSDVYGFNFPEQL